MGRFPQLWPTVVGRWQPSTPQYPITVLSTRLTLHQILRPQLATFNVSGGLLRGLKVIKPIAWGWNIPGQNILIEDHFVDAKPDNGTRDDTISFPFNTYV